MMATLGKSTELGGLILHDRIEAEIGDESGYSHVSILLYYAAVPGEKTELTVFNTESLKEGRKP